MVSSCSLALWVREVWSSRSRRYFSSQVEPSITPQEVTGFRRRHLLALLLAYRLPDPNRSLLCSRQVQRFETFVLKGRAHEQAGKPFSASRSLRLVCVMRVLGPDARCTQERRVHKHARQRVAEVVRHIKRAIFDRSSQPSEQQALLEDAFRYALTSDLGATQKAVAEEEHVKQSSFLVTGLPVERSPKDRNLEFLVVQTLEGRKCGEITSSHRAQPTAIGSSPSRSTQQQHYSTRLSLPPAFPHPRKKRSLSSDHGSLVSSSSASAGIPSGRGRCVHDDRSGCCAGGESVGLFRRGRKAHI